MTPDQNEPGCNGNNEVLNPLLSSGTGASLSDAV